MPGEHDSGGDRSDHEVLEERGWTQVSDDPPRYTGYFEKDGMWMPGGVQLAEDGPSRLYVKEPPEAFVENVGNGQHLVRTPEAADDAYLVGFEDERVPATIADGFETIRSMMTEDAVESGDGDEDGLVDDAEDDEQEEGDR